ncbi:MAG TPA: hypothetical protein VMU22_13885 [Rhizomicrobium sp.]|nr:hypothetical protein [Rhizomicrobium sp.]
MATQNETKAYPPVRGHQEPNEIETTRARQGEAPGRVRYVLAISLGLVAIAFAIIYLANFRL